MASIKDIEEIRILPPIGIARLGSATIDGPDGGAIPDAMDNYDIIDDGTASHRTLAPAPTLYLGFDPATLAAEIGSESVPSEVKFRGNEDRIRPVAPWFEVWGRWRGEDVLRSVTKDHLSDTPVLWTIEVSNRKAYRRTRDAGDIVRTTEMLWQSNGDGVSVDHTLRPLQGTAQHFLTDQSIHLGYVIFPRPSDAFPEIRLRIYPAHGLIYGHQAIGSFIPPERVIYDVTQTGATWHQYSFDSDPFATNPIGLERPGWFDDTCDGIVHVRLGEDGPSANARFTCSPPDFVPGSAHVRSGLDEFEQMILGPTLPEQLPNNPVYRQHHIESVIRTIRSAIETFRQMNANFLNPTYGRGSFSGQRVDYIRLLSTHAFYLGMVRELASDDPERFARAQAELERLGDELRDYDRGNDFSPRNQRKMPALMRGGDRGDLCLTRRQQAYIQRTQELSPPADDN